MSYLWDIENAYATKVGRYKTKIITDFIYDCLKQKEGLRILDIGGGSGRFAIPLSNLGFKLTVIDLNEEALAILKSRNEKIDCVNSYFEDYSSNKLFDIILIIEVLGNFKDLDVFFKKLDSFTSKGSSLIISTTNADSFKFKIRNLFLSNSYPGYRSINEYQQILKEYSYLVKNIKGFNWLPFKMSSNSILIPIINQLINLFFLNKWIKRSPEILIYAVKDEIS